MKSARQEIVDQVSDFLRARDPLGDGLIFDEATGLLGQGIGLDSVEALQLVARMEEAFDMTIADEDLDAAHFRTIGTFTSFIAGRLEPTARKSS
jgi:acyl carrier protein